MSRQAPRGASLQVKTLLSIAALTMGTLLTGPAEGAETSALSDEPRSLQLDVVGSRARPIVELGDTFLGNGNIASGIRLPGGAVWQPNLIIWGNYRTAVNVYDDSLLSGDDYAAEWVNRLDLFAQVSLSQTDRIVFGVRPLDEDGEFSGYRIHPDGDSVSGSNFEVNVAFFEGNLAELVPGDDDRTSRWWDMDVSVGRLPWLFQEGMLIDDRMDSVALSRNNLLFVPRAINTRVAVIYGWNDVNRADNQDDNDARMYGLFTETDFSRSTVNLDFARVTSDLTGDAWYAGISASQRIGKLNTAFRLVHSDSEGLETLQSTSGSVAVAEVSWTPPYTHNNVYTNVFLAIDDFNSASRDAATGGPLGLVGILYAATGLGAFPGPLGNDASESFGGAVGYQMFFNESRSQLIVEAGARTDTDGSDRRQFALGGRYQKALGKRLVVRVDAFVAERESLDTSWGSRLELQLKL